MRHRISRIVAAAAAVSLFAAVPGRAADISAFLTGGSGQTQDTAPVTVPDPTQTAENTGGGSASMQASAASQQVNFVTCTDPQTGLNVARAAVPEGYSVNSETTWCGACQCPDFPAEVFISAESPDGSIQLTYESPLEFLQVLNCSVNGMQLLTHQDWTINTDYLMMMLTYMNAQQYCDYTAQNCMSGATDVTFSSETPITQAMQAMLQQLSQQKLNDVNTVLSGSNQIYCDYVETTTAERTYRYKDNYGKSRILVVSATVQAVRMVNDFSSYGMGEVNISVLPWSIPGRYCLLVDEDKYEEGLAVYEAFCTNTTISDQFKQAMVNLSQQINSAVMNAKATSISSQASYVTDTFSSELSGQDDTYTSMDAWDDAILDRNDYTLSSGDSVKVDTSYDYVYELPDGNVYATNSALDEPAGGTLLYAN